MYIRTKEIGMPNILKNPLVAGLGAGALALGGGGAGGYFLGKRKGADNMAGVMATQFSAANQKENQQLAKYFYTKGLQASFNKESSMDKQAVLQEVYQDSFNDELEKIAALPGYKTTVEALKKAYGASGAFIRNQGTAVKGAIKMTSASQKAGPASMQKMYAGMAKQRAARAMPTIVAAGLSTAGLAGAGIKPLVSK